MAGCDYSLVDRYTLEPGCVVHNGDPSQSGVLDHDRHASLIRDSGSLVVKVYRRYIVFGEQDNAGGRNGTRGRDGRVHIFPEGIFYEDNAVSNTWMLRATHYVYLPLPMYFYYQHDTSTVHTVTMRNLMDRAESGRLMLEQARDRGYLEEYREDIEYSYTMLFYVNTLFSAMQERQHIPGLYGFIRRLRDELVGNFPSFLDNRYVRERLDAEQLKMIRLHLKSQTLFVLYYRALWAYRRLRSRGKG